MKQKNLPDGLTRKRKRFLEFIKKFQDKRHIAPIFKDIEVEFGLSTGAVQTYRNDLKQLGYLTWVPNRPGSLALTKKGLEALE